MDLVVMKFGGTSVATPELIQQAAAKVIARRRTGQQVVVVVSAPGDTTDDLLRMAEQITTNPDERELDMLVSTGEQVSIALFCIALKAKGYKAISLTGPQAGIYADRSHTRARITHIQPQKIIKELKKGRIVVVAGFQGVNPLEDITTLGRGGSDITAVALAAVLKAKLCEIYTDVRGVFTADPRIVSNARKLSQISYDEMMELASAGAQVMQARSIEMGKKFRVPIYVRSSFHVEEGTWITEEVKPMEEVVVSGVTHDSNQSKISVMDLPDKPGVAAEIFGALAQGKINVDMIIQSSARNGRNDISFTVPRDSRNKALTILENVRKHLNAREVSYDDTVAKVSIVGVGMRSHPGVAAKMFRSLAKQGINIQMISTSEIKISCVIAQKEVENAVKILHRAFNLGARNG